MLNLPGYQESNLIYTGTRTLVYRAFRIADQQPLIIKVLRHPHPTFKELVQFRNQYILTRHLEHPRILRPLTLEPYNNGYALIMADQGEIALSNYHHQAQSFPGVFLSIALQLAEALHYLSQEGIIHKDIKPANILIHPQTGNIKVIDFSIATLLPKEQQQLMNPNVLEGTLAYISPEQTGRMNRGIDYRTDFYSLGVTFFELLTGQLPFTSNDPMELVHCHIAQPVKFPATEDHGVPEVFQAIVLKLMAKNAEDRYQSALGLKHDLERCLQEWETTQKITAFNLGEGDICDRFLIPEKLYGREAEVQTLLDAFGRVANPENADSRQVEMMLVAGFSGIGKTAVIHEIHKPIVKQRGYFVKGKFDQFNRNIPFSAFVQALQDLMGQLLTESDRELEQWKSRILSALGENGQVIIDLVPELETIIGKQPPAPQLSGSEEQNRFHHLLQKFIQVFTTPDHPLVVFLDDLQWADLASLRLIEMLMQQREYGFLLLIGAYRDNEVSATHPLMLTVDKIIKAGKSLHTLTLAALKESDLNELIADTLLCSIEVAQPLSQLIYQKSQGNPFFATQLLKSLYSDGFIQLNRETGQWECNISAVKALMLTDDVLEFMTLQLQKLPPSCQELLKLGACVGNQFELTTLAMVSEWSMSTVASDLWPGLKQGFIIPQNEIYKFFQKTDHLSLEMGDEPEDQAFAAENLTYQFLHDRIQQAAYSLIAEDQRQTTHLHIGQILLSKIPLEEREEKLFEIVNHLNIGHALITSPQEREELAALNWVAGKKAKTATAYTAAMDYLTTGIALLPQNAWESHYDLSLALHTELAEAAYLNIDFDEMERCVHLVLDHAHTLLDTIKVQQTQLMAAKAQGKLRESLQIGLQVLNALGVVFPEEVTPDHIGQAIGTTHQLWAGQSPLSLLELPKMTDLKYLAALEIMTVMVPSSYRVLPALMPLLICKQVELSIQHGNSPISVFAYGDYGIMLSGILGDLESGYQFGQLALELLEQLQATACKSRAGFIVHHFISHWQQPLHSVLEPLLTAYQSGLATGDIECVALNAHSYCYYSYFAGKELSNLAAEIASYHAAISPLKQASPTKWLEIVQQTVLNLLGETETPWVLTGSVYNAETLMGVPEPERDRAECFHFYVNQMILAYLFEKYEESLQLSSIAETYLDGGVAQFPLVLYAFYDALIQLERYQMTTPEQQSQILTRVQQQQEKLQRWANLAPANHAHRWELVAAEYYNNLNDHAHALEYYDLAIKNAHQNNFTQDEALANELTAKFYLDRGKEKLAAVYMQDAYYGYSRWGAKAKAEELERLYPHLLQPILQKGILGTETLSTLSTVILTNSTHQTLAVTSSSSSNSHINTVLDFGTVLKASQVLARTIQLDELIHQLTQIILQNSGADRCLLLLPNQLKTWSVVAIATFESTQICEEPLDGNTGLPVGLIHYVKRTQEIVVIDDLKTNLPVLDEYLQRSAPQSVLTLPILNQGNLIGILYLENQAASGVFSKDRLVVLNFLCTQAAISLENARLYQQSQAYAHQLEQSQLQIVQSEKMSALGNLVAGVAHEINNPISFLLGNIAPAQEYVQDLLSLIDLLRSKCPANDPEIMDKIQEIDFDFLVEDLPQLLDSMTLGIERIRTISNSLRIFSRKDYDHKTAFNIHDGIDSTLLILKHRTKANEERPEIKIVKNYQKLPEVKCFPGQLNQVFMNVLANAIDALHEGNQGKTYSEIKANPNVITISTAQISADQVQIKIGDNGCGMVPETQQQIFDQGFTTKEVGKGTGLGMPIAHQIVTEKHSGTLTCESTLGKGTVFTITLPIA